MYYGKIERKQVKLFHKKDTKKKDLIACDESQSFTEIFALFDEKKMLNIRAIMEWPVFSKPWAIVNEDMKSRDNQKSLFRNGLQAMSPLTSTNTIPKDIATSIVDGMRIVRLIRVGNLQTKTFKCWIEAFVEYLISLPGSTVHLVFDDYKYEFSIPSKSRDTCNLEREINHLDQELPFAKE